jgi:hypothetical protein
LGSILRCFGRSFWWLSRDLGHLLDCTHSRAKTLLCQVWGVCWALLCRLFQVLLPGPVFQWLYTILYDFRVSFGVLLAPLGTTLEGN